MKKVYNIVAIISILLFAIGFVADKLNVESLNMLIENRDLFVVIYLFSSLQYQRKLNLEKEALIKKLKKIKNRSICFGFYVLGCSPSFDSVFKLVY
ncbi:hypothetical protein KH5_14400 [Urechidicola sp. KH5]